MSMMTARLTDDPCPACATGLILLDDRTAPGRYECRLCGWSDTSRSNPDNRDAITWVEVADD